MAGHSLQELGLGIKRAQARHHRTLHARLAPLGLSLVQWDALRHLVAHPEASLHDLAVLTFQSDQAFGTLAGRMVERGLIERLDGPGRAVRHRATRRGRELVVAGSAVADEVFAASFAPLDVRQRDALGDLLDLLNAVDDASPADADRSAR